MAQAEAEIEITPMFSAEELELVSGRKSDLEDLVGNWLTENQSELLDGGSGDVVTLGVRILRLYRSY